MSNLSRYLASSIWSKELVEYATEQYSAGTPIITDSTFDILEKQYPTNTVGAKRHGGSIKMTRDKTPRYTLLAGDIRNKIKDIDAKSLQCVVTSPPYFGHRDYSRGGQGDSRDWI